MVRTEQAAVIGEQKGRTNQSDGGKQQEQQNFTGGGHRIHVGPLIGQSSIQNQLGVTQLWLLTSADLRGE
jgi:hypothetical protein